MNLGNLPIKTLPEPLPLRKLLGPSFILLGLGLGSGELILWPYLASRFGMGIIWGSVIGITFQFFMNMEIERYALARGESVFVGFARKLRILPFWFIVSTFIPWVWPGIVAASAKLIGHVFGMEDTHYLAIVLLVIIGLTLSLGPVLYKTVENLQKYLIFIGIPILFLITILVVINSEGTFFIDATSGIFGIGKGYFLFPDGLPIATFLAALAYAGAGGNLNLAQSNYVKEKGYGMAEHAGRITSFLTGKHEDVTLEGADFEITPENISRFKVWWRNVNLEHFFVFWLTGLMTIVVLALLSYATIHGRVDTQSNITFLIAQSAVIGNILLPLAAVLFLLVAGIMLFATQLTVLDATSRIISENTVLASKGRLGGNHISLTYYVVLWLQILSGIGIFALGFTEPLQLVIVSAIMNAFAMFVHSGLTLWLNVTSFSKAIRPGLNRIIIMLCAFFFYGGFSIYVILNKIFGV